MEFERAKFELRTQDRIREKKPEIRGGMTKKLQELIDAGFERLRHLRETEEGRKNESVILKLAEELNINKKKLEKEFKQGLQFNIKAVYKTKLLDEPGDRVINIDTIIGAYTLNFRRALNWFKKEEREDEIETPKNILNVAKRMYLLSPKIIENLRNKYEDNPRVNKGMIKHFVVRNPKNPEKAIENALKQIDDLRDKYKDNPDVNEEMIKHFTVYYKDPDKAIKNALKQIKRLEKKYGDNPKVSKGMIRHFVVHNPEGPKKAIEDALERIEYFKNEYKNNPKVDGRIIKRFVVYCVRRSKKAIEDIKKGKKEEVLEQIRKFGDDKYSEEDL